MKIVCALEEDKASARQLSRRLDQGLPRISYHLGILAKAHCVRIAETNRWRGVVENFYELTPLAAPSEMSRGPGPSGVHNYASTLILQEFVDHGVGAIETGGALSPRKNSRLNCIPVALDGPGWVRVKEIMDEAEERVGAVQEASSDRLVGTEEEGIAGTIVIASVALSEAPSPNDHE